MSMYFVTRHLPWLASLAIGGILVGGGTLMVSSGIATRNLIREELPTEQVMTEADTARPGVLVEDAATAQMQADTIKHHTLGTWGP